MSQFVCGWYISLVDRDPLICKCGEKFCYFAHWAKHVTQIQNTGGNAEEHNTNHRNRDDKLA
jgi:hypothetical protein